MTSIADNKKRGPGRPKVGSTYVGIRIPPAELAALDAWIAEQPDALSRPEAMRQLMRIAITGKSEPRQR
jgi:hypothetical protein